MPKSILIVEDSEIVSMHLQKVLQRANYNVVSILASGEKAIEYIKNNDVALVIMDVMIEGKYDGIETSIEINKIKDIPVIYLTALNDRKTVERAKITFPYTFLGKPFAEAELLSNVELSLFKHKAEREKRESQKLLSTILDNIKSCVIVVDSDYRIQYVNKFTLELLQTVPDILHEFRLAKDIQLSNLNNEGISIELLQEMAYSSSFIPEIIYIHFSGRKYPINNINITNAKFYNTKNDQYLITFNDAAESLEKLEKNKKEKRLKLISQIEGAENERMRLSRELHDGLGQMLNVVKMNIKNLISDIELKEKLVNLVDASIDESHKISENLMPSKLKLFDLRSSLADLCNTFNSKELSVNFNTNLEEGDLNDNKINIYRIVQESLSNIIKHAQAKNVSVQLYKKSKGVILTIEDDGKGFDYNEIKKGLGINKSHGLINMIDRVNSMGGDIDIESDPRLGTNIIIHIKIKNYA